MLRLLAWWIYGQLLDLCKVWVSYGGWQPQSFKTITPYFAFGANLSQEVLDKRKISPLKSEPFRLEHHTMTFTQAGPYKGSAFASVAKLAGSNVYGELLFLSKLDVLRMHFFEVVPFLRKHRIVEFNQNGQQGFFYQATKEVQNLVPTKSYLEKIVLHARKNPLVPKDYLDYLEKHPFVWESERAEDVFFAVDYQTQQGLLRKALKAYDRAITLIFSVLIDFHLFRWLIR